MILENNNNIIPYGYYYLLILFITLVTLSSIQFEKSFGSSPTFVRQYVYDNSNYWIDVAQQSEPTHNELNSTDIRSVSYHSDGKYLETTFWLESAFDHTLSHIDKNITKIGYGIFIDIDLDKLPDYKLEIQKFKNRNWTKIIREFEPLYNYSLPKSSNFLSVDDNFKGFFNQNWNDRYINMTLDLEDLGYPKKYQIIFYSEHRMNCSKSGCKNVKYDFTEWVTIPIPSISVSTQPQVVEIRDKDKTIDVQINSSTDLSPLVQVHVENETGLLVNNLSNTNFPLPSFGIKTIPFKIKILENQRNIQEKIPLPFYVNLVPSPESLNGNTPNLKLSEEEMKIRKINSKNITDNTILYISILEPLTPMEALLENIMNFNNKVISPISGIWTFIFGILTLAIPWIYNRYRQKKKSNQNKKLTDF